MMAEYDNVMTLAHEVAAAGAQEALPFFRSPHLQIQVKSDESPVTQADIACETRIREAITAARPSDGWLGEESGSYNQTAEYRWIVDPIDGTKNFIHGIPLWATLVACEQRQENGEYEVIASAVHIPALQEQYGASKGGGAFCNGNPIKVSEVKQRQQALWCFETRGWYNECGLAAVFDEMDTTTKLQRGLGDAYAHMLIASGRADIMIEPSLSVWDMAAPSLIVTEAGGRFTDLQGRTTLQSGQALSTNGHLHDDCLVVLEKLGPA